MRLLPLLLLFLVAGARSFPVTPLRKPFRPLPFAADARPPSGQASDGLYWLLSDEQEDVASHSHFRHYVRKATSAAGLSEVSQVSIDVDPSHEKLELHRITLWRKGAARELLPRLSPTWLRREEDWDEGGMLDGRKTLLFNLEDVRVGDVVELAYTLRGDNPIFGGKASGTNDLQYGVPVERLHLRVVHPAGRNVYVTMREGAPDPKRVREGADEALVWDLARVPGRLDDGEAPEWYDPYPRAEWSEFSSWGEVVEWAEDLYRVDEPLSPELARFVDSLKPLDPPERIRRALRMVQDEVRYLGLEMGVSSHKPAHPDVVYARRFGDCKDKALLFCSLLRALGIDAAPALVNTRAARETPRFQPSPEAFDHVIARVRLEGRSYWFDATLDHQRGDPLANQDLPYGKGLVIARGTAGFDDIEMRGGETAVKVRARIEARAWDRAAGYTVTTEYTGAEAEEERSRYAQDSRESIVQEALNFRARAFPRIRAGDSLTMQDDTAANKVTVTESYLIDSLCTRSPADGRLECAVYPQEIASWVGVPERKIRASPYALAFPKNVEEKIVLDLPEKVAFADDRRVIDAPDFRLSWDESRRGTSIHLDYSYAAKSDHVPLERFPAYLRSLQEIRDNLGATLYPASSGWPPFARLNHLLLFFCAGWLGVGVWAARALARAPGAFTARLAAFPPEPVRAEARPLGGWLLLLGFVVVAAPVSKAFLFRDALQYFDIAAWNTLSSSGDHPWRVPALLVFLAGEITVTCAQFGLWPLFLGRRAAFPRAFAGVALVSLALRLACLALPGLSLGEFLAPDPATVVLGNILVTVTLVAGVLRSRRARETFLLPALPPARSDTLAAQAAAARET